MLTATKSLTILHYPAPVLRVKAKAIKKITPDIAAAARRMLELLHEARGVGLAGPQVGLSHRIFVACPTGEPQDDRVFINPVLSQPSRQTEDLEEGCLSIPEVRGIIRRPKSITVTATGLDGQTFTLSSDTLAARVWQHEIDHLDGVLIIDRMAPMDRLASQRQLRDLEKTFVK